MKFMYTTAVIGVLFIALLFSGCTSTSQPVRLETTVPTTSIMTSSPTPTAYVTASEQYSNALALNQYATFGTGNEQGKATVNRYEVRPNYNWTAPSWNSPSEQAASSLPLELQRGYNTETPQAGNTFLFLYVTVQNTGSKDVYAPSPQQFVVMSNGKAYSYSSVHSSDVIIDHVNDKQYDYRIGTGGTGGFLLPGESNKAEGYLIYEVPASFSPSSTYVVTNLDYQNRAVWRLG
ncbi:MAG: DUF4352 domain-containing protein [Methanoregula sp.]